MQDCLSSAGIVPGLHFLHVPVSPALPCQQLFEAIPLASREWGLWQTGEQSSQDVWSM